MESFSKKIKFELLNLPIESCSAAYCELYALVLFSGGVKKNENTIFLPHNSFVSLHRVLKLLEIASKHTNKGMRFKLNYILNSELKEKIMYIPREFQNFKNYNIPKLMIPAFLRGAFLSCGSVSNPKIKYHLEFCCNDFSLSDILIKILNEDQNLNFNPKFVSRRNDYVIYSKSSDKITDFLAYIGAKNHAMELMQIKMVKEVRNNINRTTNFEAANISKITNSASDQILAIKKLKKNKKFEFLPKTLREIADLRLKNPYSSLKDLADIYDESISKSGVNHRLQKLIEISNEPA